MSERLKDRESTRDAAISRSLRRLRRIKRDDLVDYFLAGRRQFMLVRCFGIICYFSFLPGIAADVGVYTYKAVF